MTIDREFANYLEEGSANSEMVYSFCHDIHMHQTVHILYHYWDNISASICSCSDKAAVS